MAEKETGLPTKTIATVSDFLAIVNQTYKRPLMSHADKGKWVLNVPRFSSGILGLDEALGGGWPYSKLILLGGEFSTGKTEIALNAAISVQNYDHDTKVHKLLMPEGKKFTPGRVLWIDTENAFDREWAKKKGLDVDYHVFARTETAEEAIDIVKVACNQTLFDLIILDSIAQMTPVTELESSSVTGDTLVTIRHNGKVCHKRIDSLVNCKNLEALSFTGTEFVWKPVSKVWQCNNPRTTITLKTKRGKQVEVTEDHSVYIVEKGTMYRDTSNAKCRVGVVKCVKGSEVKQGDHLLLSGCLDSNDVTHIDMSNYQDLDIQSPYNKCHVGNIPPEYLESVEFEGRKDVCKNGKYGSHIPLDSAWFSMRDSFRLYYTGGKTQVSCNAIIPVQALAYCVGLYIGDGSLHEDAIQFALGDEVVDEVIQKLTQSIKGHIHAPVLSYPREESLCHSVYICCKPFTQYFKKHFGGKTSLTKRIPIEVFSWPVNAKRAFIEGYIDSDGAVGTGKITFTSKNSLLLKDFELLLSQLGIVTSYKKVVQKDTVVKGRAIPGGMTFYLTMTERDWKKQVSRRKTNISLGHKGTPVEVVEIVKNELLQPVYDMCVPGTENFVGNGLLVHNSEDWQMGLAARLLNKAYRQWNATLAKRSCNMLGGGPAVIALNQMRYKIGIVYGDPRTLPGGQQQLYCSSIILYTRSATYNSKEEAEMECVELGGIVYKNKTFIPKQNYSFSLQLRDGADLKAGEINNCQQLVKRGKELKLVTKNAGTGYTFGGREYRTLEELENACKNDETLRLKLWRSVVTVATGAKI